MNTDEKKKSSQDLEFWKNATRKLKRGVLLATLLLVAYNLLLFLDIHSDNGIKGLGIIVCFFVTIILVAFFCLRNYRLGLARFSSLLNLGGRSAVRFIVWGFNCAVGGVILQLLVFLMLQKQLNDNIFLSLCIGNSLLIISTVIGSLGFLSLATSKGLPHDSRRGALHMSWTNIVLLIGAFLTSYCLSSNECSVMFKLFVVAINFVGTFLFYKNWNLILNPKDENDEIESTNPTVDPTNTDPTTTNPQTESVSNSTILDSRTTSDEGTSDPNEPSSTQE